MRPSGLRVVDGLQLEDSLNCFAYALFEQRPSESNLRNEECGYSESMGEPRSKQVMKEREKFEKGGEGIIHIKVT